MRPFLGGVLSGGVGSLWRDWPAINSPHHDPRDVIVVQCGPVVPEVQISVGGHRTHVLEVPITRSPTRVPLPPQLTVTPRSTPFPTGADHALDQGRAAN